MSHIEFDTKGPDWRIALERVGGKVTMTESSPIPALGKYRPLPSTKARTYTTQPRPAEHNHGTDPGDSPVIVFDLNLTLTPSEGFPLEEPYPGVKEALDWLVSGGCCLHVATAALGPQHPDDVNLARQQTVAAWCVEYGLPISFITGKVSSHVFYDDRMVNAKERDWADIMADIKAVLLTRFDFEDGIYRRQPIPEIGTPADYPDPGLILSDTPRALSTPGIDIDLHRCLFEASSSKLESAPKPGGVQAVTLIYNMGYQVRLSCQGWDPATHTPAESAKKLASLQQQVRQYGIPYDEMVAKDHGDVFVDDKGIHHADWAADLPQILVAMGTPLPDDEVTGKAERAPRIEAAVEHLHHALEQKSPSVTVQTLQPVEYKSSPVNVTVNLPEGMVHSSTSIDKGAVMVNVEPPNLNVNEGAIAVTNQASGADLEIQHPNGTKTRLKRS